MNIGLLGCGVVGSGVVKIVDSLDENVFVKKILVKDESEIKEERMTNDVSIILNDSSLDTIVECMGGLEPAHTYLKQAIMNGKNVVTSNKKMLATYQDELFALAREYHVSIRYEACVGGGIPWIENINRIRRIDQVESVRGIVNGTTNYILSTMQNEEKDFDEVLKNAQQLGYAERNPSDDIDGYDARYKIVLSSMSAFDVSSEIDTIPCFGIRNISQSDIKWAQEQNCNVKLIASASYRDGQYQAMVMPVALSQNDYFANVNQNLNIVMCDSETLGPAAFIGQGAGSLPTAHAVVQDILSIHDPASVKHTIVKNDLDSLVGTYYVRTNDVLPFNDLNVKKLENGALLLENQKFVDLKRAIEICNDPEVFVMRVEK